MPSLVDLALAAAVVAIAASLQGSVGFGFAVISSPTLALLDPTLAPVPILLMGFPLAVSTVIRERGHVDTAGLGWILAGRLPGGLLGAWVLGAASTKALGAIIGGIVLVAVIALSRGLTVRINAATRFGAGVVSGFSGASSGIGGPPIALLYSTQRGATTRSTLGVIFGVGMLVNIAILSIAGLITIDHIRNSLILAPALAAGFVSSSRLKHLIEGDRVRRAILVVSAISAVALLATSLFS